MLELTKVSMSFGGIEVLRDVSLSLASENRIGLTGGNGTGKSTLVNIATGFLRPTAGQIKIDGKRMENEPAWKFARLGIRRSFQTSRMQPSVPLREQFMGANIRTALLPQMFEASGLSEYLGRFPSEIPLPALRKAEVVRALISFPRVLFLDEPSAGLSHSELNQFAEFLNRFMGSRTALVIVEHRTDLMMKVISESYVLENKQLKLLDSVPDA